MVYVPGGQFSMGSDSGREDEQPVHTVALDGFWIDQTEVTAAQFAAFVNERGNQTQGGTRWLILEPMPMQHSCPVEQAGDKYQAKPSQERFPVVQVSWYGAAAYCEWAGARLPTEAEWEYAARGPDGHMYPWGDAPPSCERANFAAEDRTMCAGWTASVVAYVEGASWSRARNMAGNVFEWITDWYDATYYQELPRRNPQGPDAGQMRVMRGGSWLYPDPSLLNGAARAYGSPGQHQADLGFRCASTSLPAGSALVEPPAAHPRAPVDLWARPADAMDMVYVRGGAFQMGSTDSEVEDALALCQRTLASCPRQIFEAEQPAHKVRLRAFWLDRTEVTVAQFRAFVDATGYETVAEADRSSLAWEGDEQAPRTVEGADWRHPQGPGSEAEGNQPVVHVSWDDAVAYCEWSGARLPTEAEWEYAARGPDGDTYPWGNEAPTCEKASFHGLDGPCVRGPAPVGSHAEGASWCGALDLAGNVLEWVTDWYDTEYYSQGLGGNPTGPTGGDRRVLRGGSWADGPVFLRGAFRGAIYPDASSVIFGFRCARDVRPATDP